MVVDIFVGRMPTSERAGQFDGLWIAVFEYPVSNIPSLSEGQPVLPLRFGEIITEEAVPGTQQQAMRDGDGRQHPTGQDPG